MKRLIITGIPCSKKSWLDLFDQPEDFVVTSGDLYSQNPHLFKIKDLARLVAKRIDELKPDVLVSHDLGVTLSFVALLRQKKQKGWIPKKWIVFNGAVRGFNVFKANHPVRAQFNSPKQIREEVIRRGGSYDELFSEALPQVRATYRQIIGFSLLSQIRIALGMEKSL